MPAASPSPQSSPAPDGPPPWHSPSPWPGLLHAHSNDLYRLQRLIDPLLLLLLFWAVVVHKLPSLASTQGLLACLLVGFCSALILPQGRLYQSYRQGSLLTLLRRLTVSWLTVLGTLLALAFAAKVSALFSRIAVMSWAGLGWALLVMLHVGGRKLLRWHRSRGGNSRTLLYWGLPDAAFRFHAQLADCPYLGLRLVAWFSPLPCPALPLPAGMPPCGGGLHELRLWLQQEPVDQIVFSHVPRDDLTMADLIRSFGDTCLPVIYAPHWASAGMTFRLEQVGDQPCLDLWRPHDSLLDRLLKRLFDLLVASAALTLFSPLLLLISVAIRLSDPGPVFFRQDRYGLDGRRFRILKFRTMHVLEAGDQPGLQQARRHDPRITPLGRLLRRWSLDELPQLWNVLCGSMSIVGPRPHAVDHNEHYRRLIPGYMQRHLCKPGITGLAQVQGLRGETSTLEAMERRVAADLEYQRDWSLAGDLKILLKTVLHLRSSNAY